jgi:hypothetical protein
MEPIKKYVAEFKYDKLNIAEIFIVKETDKTYIPDQTKIKQLTGWVYVSRRIMKDDAVTLIFDNLKDALLYGATKARERVIYYEDCLKKAKAYVDGFESELSKT